MTLFLTIWVVLVGAAAGLAVGALRGRELRRGSCAGRSLTGGPLDGCGGCVPTDDEHRITGCGR
jgi:hypothetical protein